MERTKAAAATELWKIIKFGKNEENPCSTCLQSISRNDFGNPETQFSVSESGTSINQKKSKFKI